MWKIILYVMQHIRSLKVLFFIFIYQDERYSTRLALLYIDSIFALDPSLASAEKGMQFFIFYYFSFGIYNV